jgi:hypothetical protein
MRSFLLPKVLQYYIQDYVDQSLKYGLMISDVKRDLKSYYAHFEHIPSEFIVKLFVNGIYNKLHTCPPATSDRSHVVGNTGRGLRSTHFVYSETALNTHLNVMLDTIYYGYSLSPSATERPHYEFGNLADGNFRPVLVPCSGHNQLTDRIAPPDLMHLVIMLSRFGDKFSHPSSGYKTTASKEFIHTRDRTLYQFLVLLQHYGNKFRARYVINQKSLALIKASELRSKLTTAAAKKLATAEKRTAKKLATAEKRTAKLAASKAKKQAAAEKHAAKLAAIQEKKLAAADKRAAKLAAIQEKKLAAVEKRAAKLAAIQEKKLAAATKPTKAFK